MDKKLLSRVSGDKEALRRNLGLNSTTTREDNSFSGSDSSEINPNTGSERSYLSRDFPSGKSRAASATRHSSLNAKLGLRRGERGGRARHSFSDQSRRVASSAGKASGQDDQDIQVPGAVDGAQQRNDRLSRKKTTGHKGKAPSINEAKSVDKIINKRDSAPNDSEEICDVSIDDRPIKSQTNGPAGTAEPIRNEDTARSNRRNQKLVKQAKKQKGATGTVDAIRNENGSASSRRGQQKVDKLAKYSRRGPVSCASPPAHDENSQLEVPVPRRSSPAWITAGDVEAQTPASFLVEATLVHKKHRSRRRRWLILKEKI